MPSIEILDFISEVAWKIFDKASAIQERFWLKKPIHWDVKTKHASHRPIKKCIPLLLWTIFQVPTYSYSFLIMYRQSTEKYADPRFPFSGVVILAFGSVMNLFITFGSLSNFYKKKEWALCLNVIAQDVFHKKPKTKKPSPGDWRKASLFRGLTISDVIANGVVAFLLSLAGSGFTLPFGMDVDPIAYIFIDVPVRSREWYILKYGIRPVCWCSWSCYCTWTFYNITACIFFVILHSCTKIPRTPKSSKSQKLTVITNSLTTLTFGKKLAIRLMEGAYKEYREFQVFIRPANDATYFVLPDGLAGISCVSVIGGFATLKAYSVVPISIYFLFPAVFFMCMSLIIFMIPIACSVFESALDFRRYWLSRFTRKEVRKRIIALRPMGIAAGPFGYIHRSLPMTLTDAIIDFICSLSLSTSL